MQLDNSKLTAPQVSEAGSATKSPRLDDTELIILSVAADRSDRIALPLSDTITAPAEQLKSKILRMIRHDLLEEMPAKLEDGLWRKDKEDRHLTLRITDRGLAMLGLDGQDGPEGSSGGQKPVSAHAKKPLSSAKSVGARAKKSNAETEGARTKKSPSEAGTARATKKIVASAKANHHQSAGPIRAPRKSTRSKHPPSRSAAVALKKPSPDAKAGSTSKTGRILKLLGRPSGATLDELKKASGWQAHSVRGFLSAVVKKRLRLKLLSEEDGKGRRCYRIRQKAKA